MANNITIELAAQDRARLDKIITLLETIHPLTPIDLSGPTQGAEITPQELEAAEPTNDTPETEKAPQAEAEPAESPSALDLQPEDETLPPEFKAEAQPEPSVTLEQIQQKVVQLCALDGGAKKAAVRQIISQYGQKVSDLKDQPEKWDAVWAQLCGLE